MMKKGLALIEICVVLAIVAILGSLLLMAVLATRESVRKISCANNLRQIGIGLQSYHAQSRTFPPANGGGFSFHVRLLPHIGENAKFNAVDFTISGRDQIDAEWARVPRLLTCPTDPFTHTASNRSSTNYIGISGGGTERYNGIIVSVSRKRGYHPVSAASVTDGLSNTIAVTESAAYLRYGDGTQSTYRDAATYRTTRSFELPGELEAFSQECFANSPLEQIPIGLGSYWTEPSSGVTKMNCIYPKQPRNCANQSSMLDGLFAPSSLHTGGVYCAFADGSVRIIPTDVDAATWRSLGSRNDGKALQLGR